MLIPEPGDPLPGTPNHVTLPKGTTVFRVHNRRYEATQFNPYEDGLTRFAPINDKDGQCVPSLYAAGTLEAAVYETIFHSVDNKAKPKQVREQDVLDRAAGVLEACRDLTLVSLREADLNLWSIGRDALITSPSGCYSKTVKWAGAIYQQCPQAEGLAWTSRPCDPATAYLFFGDRVDAKALEIIAWCDGEEFLTAVRRFGKRSGIVVV